MRATVSQLQKVMKRAPLAWLVPITEIPERYGIDTPNEIASFVAQLAHESAELTRLEENLNYSADGLARVWPGRFSATGKRGGPPNERALKLARRPEAIANAVYSGRYGNGDEASGDGWLFRGRGPIQLTFRGNYAAIGEAIGIDLVKNPGLALTPAIGVEIACVFWRDKGLDRYDDDADARDERRIVNGGEIGLADVQHYLDKGLEAIA